MPPDDLDVDEYEQETPNERVTIAANPFDRASRAERKALRAAAVHLIDMLFNSYLAVVRNGGPFNSEREICSIDAIVGWPGFRFLPKAYLHCYDAQFFKQVIVAATALCQKLFGPTLPDLSCTIEEILFSSIAQIAGEDSPRVKFRILEAWRDRINQDFDYEMLFDQALDGFADDQRLAHLGFANLRVEEWFRPFGNASHLNAYFDDERALASVPVHHSLYDAVNGGEPLAYQPPRRRRKRPT
jgi:hypothetical protein